MVLAKIAFKNLSRQKRRTFLLGGAIAFGIMVLTLVNALAGGMLERFVENIAQLVSGHIFISASEKLPSGRVVEVIRDDGPILKALDKAQIPYTSLSRRSEAQASLIFGQNSAFLQLSGVDWNEEKDMEKKLALIDGRLDRMAGSRGIALGQSVAKKLNAQLLDTIIVQIETVTGQQNVGELQVEAIFQDPSMMGSVFSYIDRDYMNQLIDLKPGEYNNLGLTLKNMGEVEIHAVNFYEALKAQEVKLFDRMSGLQDFQKVQRETYWEGSKVVLFTINDILSFMKNIFVGLQFGIAVVVLVLFLVIMVGIVNTYRMIVFERTREIGTMRALGMQRSQVRGLFLLEATFLSLGGVLAGFVLGYAVAAVLSLIDLSKVPGLEFFLRNGHFALAFDLITILVTTILVTILTRFAAGFPARRAAKLSPAEALRTSF